MRKERDCSKNSKNRMTRDLNPESEGSKKLISIEKDLLRRIESIHRVLKEGGNWKPLANLIFQKLKSTDSNFKIKDLPFPEKSQIWQNLIQNIKFREILYKSHEEAFKLTKGLLMFKKKYGVTMENFDSFTKQSFRAKTVERKVGSKTLTHASSTARTPSSRQDNKLLKITNGRLKTSLSFTKSKAMKNKNMIEKPILTQGKQHLNSENIKRATLIVKESDKSSNKDDIEENSNSSLMVSCRPENECLLDSFSELAAKEFSPKKKINQTELRSPKSQKEDRPRKSILKKTSPKSSNLHSNDFYEVGDSKGRNSRRLTFSQVLVKEDPNYTPGDQLEEREQSIRRSQHIKERHPTPFKSISTSSNDKEDNNRDSMQNNITDSIKLYSFTECKERPNSNFHLNSNLPPPQNREDLNPNLLTTYFQSARKTSLSKKSGLSFLRNTTSPKKSH